MKKRIIAIFAAVALLLTILAIPVFADDDETPILLLTSSEDENAEDGEMFITSINDETAETETVENAEAVEETVANAEDVEAVEENAEDGEAKEDETETTGDTDTTGSSEVTVDGGDNVVDDPFEIDEKADAETETTTGMTEDQKTLLIWNLVIGGIVLAIIIALVVVFFFLPKNREKTLKFFRGLKSEWKKIAWFSWKNTWKGTLVVAIVSVVIAIVIGLLDTGFSQGLNALSKFF